MSIEDTLKAYIQTLDDQNRKPDFIYNGTEYFEIEWPRLKGLAFCVKNDTIIIESSLILRSKL